MGGIHRSPVDSPYTKASDAELWWFIWFAPEQTAEQAIERPVIWRYRAHYYVTVMKMSNSDVPRSHFAKWLLSEIDPMMRSTRVNAFRIIDPLRWDSPQKNDQWCGELNKWLNTVELPVTWEFMSLLWRHGNKYDPHVYCSHHSFDLWKQKPHEEQGTYRSTGHPNLSSNRKSCFS